MKDKKINYQSDWEEFAQLDPMWAIITDKNKKYNKWNNKEFFETGKREIKNFLINVKKLNIKIKFGTALDFGCGIGRLTRALSKYFKKIYGVDISPSMIELANKYNKYPDKCDYILNDKDDLSIFKDNSFDFIYTNIVLQHIPDKKIIKNYLIEFLRILKPEGLLYFHLPTVPDYTLIKSILCKLRAYIYYLFINLGFSKKFCFSRLKITPYMYMNHVSSEEIKTILSKKATILKIEDDKSIGTKYFVKKNTFSKLIKDIGR